MAMVLLWCVELLPIIKSGVCLRWRASWIRLAIPAYCMIPFGIRLVGHGFVLMQNDDPKHTSKDNQTYIKTTDVLAGAISGIKSHLTGVEGNWPKSQSKATNKCGRPWANSCRKAGQNYIQSTSSLWWKECRKSMKQW